MPEKTLGPALQVVLGGLVQIILAEILSTYHVVINHVSCYNYCIHLMWKVGISVIPDHRGMLFIKILGCVKTTTKSLRARGS